MNPFTYKRGAHPVIDSILDECQQALDRFHQSEIVLAAKAISVKEFDVSLEELPAEKAHAVAQRVIKEKIDWDEYWGNSGLTSIETISQDIIAREEARIDT